MRLQMPDLSNPNVRFRMLLYLGALAIFGLLFLSAIFPLSSNPVFCGKLCHNMNPEYYAWQKSAHAKVTCYACHINPSYIHLLQDKMTAGPMGIFNTVLNRYEKPINEKSHYSQEDLPMERCERCHANENRKFTFTRGIYMNHEAHKEAGINCAVCHNRVAHKGAEDYEPLKSWPEAVEAAEKEGEEKFHYKNFLTMKQGCFRCHSGSQASRNPETVGLIENGKKPPTACTTCHTSDFGLPEGHGESSWRSAHGELAKQNFDYCFECHDAGAKFDNGGEPWCTLCHDDKKVDAFKQQQASAPPAAPAETAEAPPAEPAGNPEPAQ